MTENSEVLTNLQPHHDGSAQYVLGDDLRLGDTVTVRLRVPSGADVTSVSVRVNEDGERQMIPACVEEGSDAAGDTWWQAELQLSNPTLSYRFRLEGEQSGIRYLNAAGLWGRDVPDDSDFRITSYANPPAWLTDAIVYQVFPDRFATTDKYSQPAPTWAIPTVWDHAVQDVKGIVGRQFYGGDLDGITDNIPHIKALGVTVIYLTPIFPAGSNHRYDAASFDRIDEYLGGDEALTRLCEAAHRAGLRVIGDFTSNHTGRGHDWFAAASANEGSAERAYYYWNQDGSHVGWLGRPSLPKLNHSSAGVRDQLFTDPSSPVRKWLAAGLDGWRIDVANMTGRSGEHDFTHDVARSIRRGATLERPDAYIVAEHFYDYTKDLGGDGWHGVMNYAGFTFPVWGWLRRPGDPELRSTAEVPMLNGKLMVETIGDFTSRVPWVNRMASLNILDSHDTARITTILDGDFDRVSAAVALLMTMPGVPMVEYGDETGMEGLTGEDGRRAMPWDARGQLDQSAMAAHLRWDPQYEDLYRELIAIRRESEALRTGGLRWIHVEDDAVVFLREREDQTVLVHVARAAHDPIQLPLGAFPGADQATLRFGKWTPAEAGDQVMCLGADSAGATILSW